MYSGCRGLSSSFFFPPSCRINASGVPRSQRRVADGAARGGQDVCRQERGGDRPSDSFRKRGNAFSGALPVDDAVREIFIVHIQPRKHGARSSRDFAASTRQHDELDHTDEEHICPERSVSHRS